MHQSYKKNYSGTTRSHPASNMQQALWILQLSTLLVVKDSIC